MNESTEESNASCRDCEHLNPTDDVFETVDLDLGYPSCSVYDDE